MPSDGNTGAPQTGIALVVEGGGQKGAFTAGVLDSWLVSHFNPFEILIGTSAGAQNIASYLSQQTGYAYSLIANLTRKPDFFNPWRLFMGKNVMDLDWYFNQAQSPIYAFDTQRATKNAQNRIVRFLASDQSKLATELIDPLKHGWLQSMKYSSSIPYLYHSPKLIDGGVTAPIPVTEAHQLGAKTIVTIRTTMDTSNLVPKSIKHLKSLVCSKGDCPTFIKLVDEYKDAYLKAEAFIQAPPPEVNVLEIKPIEPLQTAILGSSEQSMSADYKQGFTLGMKFLHERRLDKYLQAKELHCPQPVKSNFPLAPIC